MFMPFENQLPRTILTQYIPLLFFNWKQVNVVVFLRITDAFCSGLKYHIGLNCEARFQNPCKVGEIQPLVCLVVIFT